MRFCVLGAADGWYSRDLIRAAGDRHEMLVVPFSRLQTGFGLQTPPYFRSVDQALEEVDAVLVRTMPPGSLEQVVFRMDVLGRLEARGTPVLNPPRTLEAAVDKYLSLARLHAAGIPVPDTWVGQGVDEAMEAFARLGGDVVIKPLFGSEGRGMLRADSQSLAWRAAKTLTQLSAVIYMQRFVAHQGFDVRVLVLGEQSLAIKRVNPSDWRTNVSVGARAEPFTPSPLVLELARRAAAALSAPLAGVDLISGPDDRWYVLEINAVPGWRALSQALKVDVANLVLQFLERTVANGPTTCGFE